MVAQFLVLLVVAGFPAGEGLWGQPVGGGAGVVAQGVGGRKSLVGLLGAGSGSVVEGLVVWDAGGLLGWFNAVGLGSVLGLAHGGHSITGFLAFIAAPSQSMKYGACPPLGGAFPLVGLAGVAKEAACGPIWGLAPPSPAG